MQLLKSFGRIALWISQLSVFMVVVFATTAAYWPMELSVIHLLPAFSLYLLGPILLGTWFWRKRKPVFFYMHAVMCMLLIIDIPNKFQWNEAEVAQDGDLKVLSFNVAQFGHDSTRMNGLLELIRQTDADVVCLQEFGVHNWWPYVDSVAPHVAQQLNLPYSDFTRWDYSIYGVAIFSRYPIVQTEELFTSRENTNAGGLYVIQRGDERLGIVNLHMASFNFSMDLPEEGSILHKSRKFVSLLHDRMLDQQAQLKLIQNRVSEAQFPVILCGDLNFVPQSGLYEQFCETHRDSYQDRGRGSGYTLDKGIFKLRIDYQWVPPEAAVISHEVLDNNNLSDHKPLLVNYRL